jgi:hypothetical protein
MAELSEDQIAKIIYKAMAEWDRIHGDGWNEPYLTPVPSMFHLAAKRILEAASSQPAAT